MANPKISPLDRFALAPSIATPRILATSFGDYGSGKSYFWLTAPAPVVVLGFDRGMEGVVEEFRQEGKDIRLVDYDWTPPEEDGEFSQQLAKDILEQFTADYKFACQHARTVVIDRETDLWSLVRYAQWGMPKADVPRDFDKANQRMRSLISHPKKLTINMGAIQSVKDEWVSQSKKSGGQKRAGFAETPGLLMVDLFHERIDGKFYVTIGKARGPKDIVAKISDTQFESLDFPTLGMMLFENTDVSDWTS